MSQLYVCEQWRLWRDSASAPSLPAHTTSIKIACADSNTDTAPKLWPKTCWFQSPTYLSLHLHASSFPPSRPHFLCLETDTQSAQPYFSAVSVLCILIFLFNLNLYSTHYPCSSVKLSEKSSIILTVSSPISAIIFLEMIISKTDNTV